MKHSLLLTGVLRPYSCKCGRNYKNKRHLRQHQRLECDKEPRFLCCFCPFMAKRKENLGAHAGRDRSLVPADEGTRISDTFGNTSDSSATRNRDILVPCVLTGRSGQELSTHTWSCATVNVPVRAEGSRGFLDLAGGRFGGSNLTVVSAGPSPATTAGNKFLCTCGRSYKYKQGLAEHQRYECGKEPMFQCSFCPYRAKKRNNFKAHVVMRHAEQLTGSFG
ncbi:hypothetical protein J6590_014747 [Homalodisca vitripennis]|nr:hypothetical protein J6590_014747 [Homalodisca vitripennis]